MAPVVVEEPTSSWSKAARTAISRLSAASRAVSEAWTETRLSCRWAARNSGADDGRGLGVVGVGVHADDVAGGRPGGLGDPPEDGTVPRRPDRVQMPLAVERQRVLAVQVRGELRDET